MVFNSASGSPGSPQANSGLGTPTPRESKTDTVRRKMDRMWHAVESADLASNDIMSRIREYKECQEKRESPLRTLLSEQREVLDDVDTLTAYAQDMRAFLLKSGRTESRAFIRSFVHEIDVAPQGCHSRLDSHA